MNLPDQSVIDQLKLDHPNRKLKLFSYATDDGQEHAAICLVPNRSEYLAYQSGIVSKERAEIPTLTDQYVRRHIKYPSPADLNLQLNAYPALTGVLATEIQKACGSQISVEARDL